MTGTSEDPGFWRSFKMTGRPLSDESKEILRLVAGLSSEATVDGVLITEPGCATVHYTENGNEWALEIGRIR